MTYESHDGTPNLWFLYNSNYVSRFQNEYKIFSCFLRKIILDSDRNFITCIHFKYQKAFQHLKNVTSVTYLSKNKNLVIYFGDQVFFSPTNDSKLIIMSLN